MDWRSGSPADLFILRDMASTVAAASWETWFSLSVDFAAAMLQAYNLYLGQNQSIFSVNDQLFYKGGIAIGTISKKKIGKEAIFEKVFKELG